MNRHSWTAPFWTSYWLNHVMESCIIFTSSSMVDLITKYTTFHRPFEDCTNHDYFFFDAFLLVPSTIVVFDVWLSSIAQKYANLWRTMKELQLLQSFDHFQLFLFYYLKELFCFTWQYELKLPHNNDNASFAITTLLTWSLKSVMFSLMTVVST